MKIQLSSVFQLPSRKMQTLVRFEGHEIAGYEVSNSLGFELNLSVAGNDRITVQGNGDMSVKMPCARCLREIEQVISLDFSYTFDQYTLLDEDSVPVSFVSDGELDTDELLSEETVLNLPMYVYCRPDCKGLCPMCGADLNLTPCSCKKEEVPNSFSAALMRAVNGQKQDD